MTSFLADPPPFHLFGAPHLVALGVVLAVAVVMIWRGRRAVAPADVRGQEIVLAVLLILRFPGALLVNWLTGQLDREGFFPMQLCDVAALTGGVALATRHPLCAELTYFWGIAGTLNGLITPTVVFDFPHPAFFLFFWLHGGVVLAAAYLIGIGLWPRPGAYRRAVGYSLGYMALALLTNWLTGANYAFLCAPPPAATLFDCLGPWPWYLLSLIALGFLLFGLLYAPFYVLRKFGWRNA